MEIAAVLVSILVPVPDRLAFEQLYCRFIRDAQQVGPSSLPVARARALAVLILEISTVIRRAAYGHVNNF
jgi:hypothetical protein